MVLFIPYRIKTSHGFSLRSAVKIWIILSTVTLWIFINSIIPPDWFELNRRGPSDIDAAQVEILDYLHGLPVDASSFQNNLNQQLKFAKSMISMWRREYNRKDFAEMARRTRTLYIAYLLTHEYPISPSIQIPAPHQIFLNVLATQTFSLFPFLSPSFGSLQELHETYTSQPLDSVGISITCGSRQYYTTYHIILSLRRVFNISTPIQIFYAGDKDLHPHLAQKLSSVPNVETIDLTTLFPNEMKELDGWSLKPFAALASRFRTVIYMDADVLFFESPLRILDSPKFKETGQFYYHDRRNREERFIPGTKWFRSLLSNPSESAKDLGYLTGKTSHEMDSGFFILDKSRAGILFSLLLACKMNSKVERGVLYSMTYGDKESFWFANELLRVPFAFSRHFGSVIGMSDSALSTDTYPVVCGVWLLQLDESGKPFWWNGGGVLKDREAKRGFEYLEFERMAFDLDGEKTHWLPGHCLNTTTGLVRELNMKERGVMETYNNVYQTFVDRVDSLDV